MAATSNRQAVEELLASLRDAGPLDTVDEALGRLALTLAEALDAGAGMATAAVSKELRATLAALTDRTREEDDDDVFGADLPAAIRDTSES